MCRGQGEVCFASNLSEGLAPCVHAFKVVTFRTNALVLQTRLPTFGMQELVVSRASLSHVCVGESGL